MTYLQRDQEARKDVQLDPTSTRLLAAFVDHVIAWVGTFALVLAASAFVAPTSDLGALVFSGLPYVPVFLGYKIVTEAHYGQTPGKRTQDLTVRMTDGSRCTWYAATVRNVLLVVDVLPGFYLVGGLVALTNDSRRRVGDLAAGTVVVPAR